MRASECQDEPRPEMRPVHRHQPSHPPTVKRVLYHVRSLSRYGADFASEDLVGGYCHHCHGEVPVPITPLPFVRLRVKNKQFSIHFSRVQ
jgi:hypothetical protein